MAHDGSVIIDIDGDDSKFKSKLASLGKTAIKGATVAVTAASGALAGLGAYAIKVGSAFETAMSDVSATMQISESDIENCTGAYKVLHDAAIEAGATTKYSATEAAEALNYLALAGYDAQTAASVLPSVLNLAAASGMDLAAASDMATDAMAALGIEASNENLTAFGDQMAMTAAKANTSVGQLGEAILTVGATANNLAGGTTELNAALGVLANRGTKGSEAGTALRNIILSLMAPTDQAAEAMKSLGLSVTDAEGNMRPLNDIMNDMSAGLSEMTSAESAQWLNTVFNKTDLADVQNLMAGCGEEFNNLVDNIEKSGGAMQDMADTKANNLKGAIDSLKSRAETLGIAFYESVDNPIKDVVNSAADALGSLTEAFNEGGLEGMFLKLGSLATDAAQALIANAPAIASAAGRIISSFGSGLAAALPELTACAVSMINSLADGIRQNLPQMIPAAMEALVSFSGGLRKNVGQIVDAGLNLITVLAESLIANLPVFIETVPEIITNIAGIINDNAPKLLETGLEIIGALAQGLIQAIPTLVANIPQIIQAIVAVFSAFNWIQLGQLIVNGVKAGATALGGALKSIGQNAINAFKSINWANAGTAACNFIHNAITGAAGLIGNALRAVGTKGLSAFRSINWASVGQAAINFIKSAISGAAGLVVSALRSVGTRGMQAFTSIDWAYVGKNIISGIVRGISGAASALFNTLRNLASNALNAAKNALGIKSPSKKFREEVGRWIPEGIAKGVDDNADAVQESIKEAVDPGVITRDVQDNIAAINQKLAAAVNSEMLRVSATISGGQTGGTAPSPTGDRKTVIIDYHPEQKFDEPTSLRSMDEHNRRSARGLEKVIANA